MHCQHTTNELREVKPEKNKEAQASDKKLRKAGIVTQANIDPLRQGQKLDAIDQKSKQSPKQSFSLSQVQLSQNEALSLSNHCAQQVFQKSNKFPPCSIISLKILPLVGTCTHQA